MPDWRGRTVAVIASGPSLTRRDCDAVSASSCLVLAVNNSWQMVARCDALYACDLRWWQEYGAAVPDKIARYSQDGRAGEWGAEYIESREAPGFSICPKMIHRGGNGGYQALNLAVVSGAGRVIMLGYDCKTGPGGEQHWHADHPAEMNNPERHLKSGAWARQYDTIGALPCDVVNCTRDTAITRFPRRLLEDVLCEIG